MANIKDLKGKKFHKLTVIEEVGRNKHGCALWLCKCDCGKEKIIPSSQIGKTRSCGCLLTKARIENMKKLNGFYHGYSKERLHHIWICMKNRCLNPKNFDYKHYGARGITVCDEWLDYENFKKWALENGYKENLSIDRIDNAKDYSPDNCRWATMQEQVNNRRNTVYLTYNGETHTLKQWAEIIGITYSCIHKRYSAGKCIKEILKKRG